MIFVSVDFHHDDDSVCHKRGDIPLGDTDAVASWSDSGAHVQVRAQTRLQLPDLKQLELLTT